MKKWLLALLLLTSAPALAAWHSVLQISTPIAFLPTTNIAAVFSVRKAVSGYAGSSMQLLKTGGTTQDIGFVGIDFDKASANTFLAGSKAWANIWYDQAGVSGCAAGSCDVSQATQANRPLVLVTADPTGANAAPGVGCGGINVSGSSPQGLQSATSRVLALTGDQTIGGVVFAYGSELGDVFSDYDTAGGHNGWGLATGAALPTGSRSLAYWSSTKAAYVNDGTSNLFTGRPVMVTVTRASGVVTFYVNGVQQGATVSGGGNSAPTALLNVCRNNTSGGSNFNGAVQELYAYSSALSATDLQTIWNGESAYFHIPNSAPVGYATASAISFGGVALATGQAVVGPSNVFNYERTQAWTITCAMRLYALPPVASMCMTNVLSVSPFTGYELWVNAQCQINVRIINTTSTNWIDKNGSVTLCDNRWHTITATYDGSSTAAGVLLYNDGVIDPSPTVGANTLSASIVSGTQVVYVGNQNNHLDFFVRGELNYFRLYNVVKSGSFITTNMVPPAVPPADADCQIGYNFDGGSSGTTETDVCGAHNGTLTSAVQRWPQ